MKRREFLTALGGAVAWPLAAHAQQPKKIPRVGVLWHAGSAEEEAVYLRVLTKAFSDLGYVEGKTIDLEHRFPAEQPDRFRSLARELVESKVDAIIAVTALGAKEAKQASRTIPIVVVVDADPIGDGLVESLAHPGGNVTGLSLMAVDLSGKRLALLKEAVPNLSSALAHKMPTIVANAEMVPFGPLISYGPDFLDYFRRAAGYMDKILKGAKPDSLPVEQPSRFKTVINAKTAKALGLNIPTSLLINADEIIE